MWNQFAEIGIDSSLSLRKKRSIRFINMLSWGIGILLLLSTIRTIILHPTALYVYQPDSFAIAVQFGVISVLLFIIFLNYKRKHQAALATFITYNLLNIITVSILIEDNSLLIFFYSMVIIASFISEKGFYIYSTILIASLTYCVVFFFKTPLQLAIIKLNDVTIKNSEFNYFLQLLILSFTSLFVRNLVRDYENESEKQKEAILAQNTRLEAQKNQLIASEEELRQQQDEIISQRDHLKKANETLEFQHRQIQKSMQAGLLIQQAVLPEEAELKALFKDYFVLYRPKDIVSGDFYWVKAIKNKGKDLIFIAVADCTGHGVQGAFMTMIGQILLEEIIGKGDSYSPAEILKQLHEKINQSVNKNTSHSYGMDIALCVIDKSKNKKEYTLCYAGAKSPLLYALPDSPEIQEVKPSRLSVAILSRKEVNYQEHNLTLPKNSTIYLFSDGYIDQCNAQRNRMGTRSLKILLANHVGDSLVQKKKLLEYELDSYQLGADQRDDILVCGFRI